MTDQTDIQRIEIPTDLYGKAHTFCVENRLMPELLVVAGSVLMAGLNDMDEQQRYDKTIRIIDEMFVPPETMNYLRDWYRGALEAMTEQAKATR